MAGTAKPRGAARTSSKKGPTGGTGGKNKRRKSKSKSKKTNKRSKRKSKSKKTNKRSKSKNGSKKGGASTPYVGSIQGEFINNRGQQLFRNPVGGIA